MICPVAQPQEGYVVYEDTRRAAAASRRLDKTLDALHEEGISAHGYVVETDPVNALRDALAQLERPPAEIIVSTHPQPKSGWLRKNVVDRMRAVAGDVPLEHVVVDIGQEGGAANVLVVANETVVGEPLLDRIRERAGRSQATFLIISPQSDPTIGASRGGPAPAPRAGELRGDGIEAHGQVAHPDPFTAAMHAVRDERVDEIIVSTFPGEQLSAGCAGDLVERLRKDTEASGRARRGRPEPVAPRSPPDGTRTPTLTRTTARRRELELAVDSRVLGMLLFIASEIMLFGSFFTAYFFVRVVNKTRGRRTASSARLRGGHQHLILVTSSFTMHWALQSIKRGNRAGLRPASSLTFLMGLTFLLTQILEYSRIGFAPRDNSFATIFFSLTGLHGAHVFVGLTLLLVRDDPLVPRPLTRRSTTTASRSPESTGTSST